MPVSKRIAVVAAAGLFSTAAAAAVFALGTPTTPRAPSGIAASAAAPSATASPGAEADPAGVAADGSDPLAIEVPGCVCHSDDPQLVADHATRRMSECFDCHQGGMPGMGQ